MVLAASLAAVVGATPIVVELYSSEGCSSCPPAEAALEQLVRARPEGVELIALELHVDYWNHLGWKDPFSSSEFSADQERVARRNGWGLYTPMTIVDGSVAFPGGGRRLAEAVAAAARRPKLPLTIQVTRTGQALTAVIQGVSSPHVEVAVVESGLVSQVSRGENAGRRLAHAPVVRWRSRAKACEAKDMCFAATVALDPRWRQESSRVVAIVRASEDGPVVGAASAEVR